MHWVAIEHDEGLASNLRLRVSLDLHQEVAIILVLDGRLTHHVDGLEEAIERDCGVDGAVVARFGAW